MASVRRPQSLHASVRAECEKVVSNWQKATLRRNWQAQTADWRFAQGWGVSAPAKAWDVYSIERFVTRVVNLVCKPNMASKFTIDHEIHIFKLGRGALQHSS